MEEGKGFKRGEYELCPRETQLCLKVFFCVLIFCLVFQTETFYAWFLDFFKGKLALLNSEIMSEQMFGFGTQTEI